jgi:hypothetical protein
MRDLNSGFPHQEEQAMPLSYKTFGLFWMNTTMFILLGLEVNDPQTSFA